MFAEPWAHDAKGYELRWRVASPRDKYDHQIAIVELIVWRYKEALRTRDGAEADAARADLSQAAARLRAEDGDWWVSTGRWWVVALAVEAGDLEAAAEEVLTFHADVQTISPDDLEDNRHRTDARMFVSACLTFLADPRSVGHPREIDVADAMNEVGDVLRVSGNSTPALEDKRHEVLQLRAAMRGAAQPASPEWIPPTDVRAPLTDREVPADARARIQAAAAVVTAAKGGKRPEHLFRALDDMADLVSVGNDTSTVAYAAVVLADAALTVAEIHDDPFPLLAAADRLSASSSLAHLLRARAHIVGGDFSFAASEVDAALSAPDSARLGLLPHLHALRGWTIVRLDPAQMDSGIAACRAGRAQGRAKRTPADLPLARLLVEKALHQATPVIEAVPLLRVALTLCRRSSADARLVAQEAKSALAVLTGRGDVDKRLRAWRSAVRSTENAPVAAQMRLATAWVRWALGTNRIELAAEAYHHLVSLIPAAVRVRYRTDAQARVLATVREHTEEAGYWLARARRYRDAAVAVETGRAVALSVLIERDDPAVAQALREADRTDLLDRYRDALAGVDACERGHGGDSHRAWTLVKAIAQEIAAVIGADLVEPAVEYADINSAAGDGAVVYLAAANASGYALVVAARHDPQCVWLPDLDRGAVEDWLHDQSGTFEERVKRMGKDLDWLWTHGMHDLLAFYARGSIVTLIPVGVMTLLPLHAAPSHAGQFTPLRYAPNARTLRWCGARGSASARHLARLLVADVPQAPDTEPLKYAAAEAAAVEAIWPGQCTRLSAATWAQFEPTAHDYDVWHIACHGHVEPRAILNSWLAFADSRVTIGDLRDRFHFAPRRLAIVSACDMHNIGENVPNESIGLPSALLHLGFAGVIAASWPVDDLATAHLMVRFHQEWRSTGAHPAIALTVAQRWLQSATVENLAALAPNLPLPDARYEGPRPFAHPYYWGAFAYTGG